MSRRLLDYDPILKIARYFHYQGDGKFTIQTVQNVGGIVEANKRQFNDAEKRFGNKHEFHHVGRIPLNLAYRHWLTQDESQVRKFLRDRDNLAWLTKPVKL